MTEADVVALTAERDADEDTGEWVGREDAEYLVCLQAQAIATKLGHVIRGWSRALGRVYGMCFRCMETVAIAPRGFNEPPMRGIPVQFQCRPRPGS